MQGAIYFGRVQRLDRLTYMQLPEQYRTAESFEHYLGDPADSDSRISFTSVLELDEREEYPFEQHVALDLWDLPEFYIPAELGGRLKSFEEVFAILRALSRRDLTVAMSHVITFLGAVPIWIAGSQDQKQMLAGLIRGRHKIAFALTERTHGGDLLANEFEACEKDGRILISGEKWLIGNATRATGITLLARTKPEGGPRGFSLVFVDKRRLDSAGFHHLPKVQTVGLRGSDLSGLRFESCAVPAAARIGPTGSGFELALKALQITRILCTALSLGAADTALRLAVDFALTRRRYGEAILSIPHARATLCNAFLDLMICDCVAISATRALHACPGQASVWSAAAKYFVPVTVESAIRDLAVVLGGSSFLRTGHPWNMFQKMARDSSIVSVFEGSTVVQLYALGLQLEQLASSRQIDEPALTRRLETVFSLRSPLPHFEPANLDLFSGEGNDAVAALPLLCKRLRSADVDEAGLKYAQLACLEQERLEEDIKRSRGLPVRATGRLQFARRYTRIHAAACCISFWIHNRQILGDVFGQGDWLSMCLSRLTAEDVITGDTHVERELLERFRHGRLFSAVPFELACKGKGDIHE
jgi:alkylation response protein AidB-like acyl-CoA dehydrogenase